MRNVHELALADMTDEELQGFYETCEVAALAWLSPRALVGDRDAAASSAAWMQKAERARAELARRLHLVRSRCTTLVGYRPRHAAASARQSTSSG